MIDLIVQKQNEEIIKRLSTLEYIIENMPSVLKMVEQNTSRRVPQSINMHNDLLERFNRLENKVETILDLQIQHYKATDEDRQRSADKFKAFITSTPKKKGK